MANRRPHFAIIRVDNVMERSHAVTSVALPPSDFDPFASPASSVVAYLAPSLPRLIPANFAIIAKDRPPLCSTSCIPVCLTCRPGGQQLAEASLEGPAKKKDQRRATSVVAAPDFSPTYSCPAFVFVIVARFTQRLIPKYDCVQ